MQWFRVLQTNGGPQEKGRRKPGATRATDFRAGSGKRKKLGVTTTAIAGGTEATTLPWLTSWTAQ